MRRMLKAVAAFAFAASLGIGASAITPRLASADECWDENSDWTGSGPKTCLGTVCPTGGGSGGFCCRICAT